MDRNKNIEKYAGVLVRCNNKVLLCKRSPEQSMPNIWSIPIGKVERGEKPKDAAIREFFEETNIIIEDEDELKLIGTVPKYTKDGKNLRGVMYIYVIESDEEVYPDLENADDGDEHTDCGYFTRKGLPFDNTKDELFRLILKNI